MGATTDKQTFYDLLYSGYVGEYQLMSALYRYKLDALRPPADMGIDIIATNLKAQLEEGAEPETFLFQVKTTMQRTLEPQEEGSRKKSIVRFALTEGDIKALRKGGKNRALVCYVYDDQEETLLDSTEAPFFCVWLDGTKVNELYEKEILTPIKEKNGVKHAVRFRIYEPDEKKPENTNWYAYVIDRKDNDRDYLGTVTGGSELTKSDANHYSIKGYLDYARG